MNFQELRRAMSGRLWFIHEPRLLEMLAFCEMAGRDGAGFEMLRAHLEAENAIRAARTRSVLGDQGTVSVVPLYGAIAHRGSLWSMYFGGAAVEDITQQLRQAVNDPTVKAIVMDVDSPGGDVEGIDELATEIYQARKQKPITAVSNSLCASAAYYLASQASELLVSPSSLTGSIGVYTTHEDYSGALDNAGIKVSLIKFGENKAEGNPYEPLTDPARQHMQDMVDTFGQQFEKAVARGRGIKQDDVHKKFGQGRVFDAKKAVQLGMADRVGTYDDALAKHGAVRPGERQARASLNVPFVAASAEEKKTKRVDGEDLEKSAFAYQGSDKLEDWKLPIEFSTEEKSKSHVRNAIARWSKTDMPDAEEKKHARSRIKAAAKKYSIDLADGDLASDDSSVQANEDGDHNECTCTCDACAAGNCDGCACDGCDSEGCTAADCKCDQDGAAAKKKAQAARSRRLALAGI